MPRRRSPYPAEFRHQMVELVRAGPTPEELSRAFEPSAQAIRNWVVQTDRDEGRRPDGLTSTERENPPINPDQEPKAMSPSDPSAAWTTRGRHKVMFGYSLNCRIDMEGTVILDVEAPPTRTSKEIDATETMI